MNRPVRLFPTRRAWCVKARSSLDGLSIVKHGSAVEAVRALFVLDAAAGTAAAIGAANVNVVDTRTVMEVLCRARGTDTSLARAAR